MICFLIIISFSGCGKALGNTTKETLKTNHQKRYRFERFFFLSSQAVAIIATTRCGLYPQSETKRESSKQRERLVVAIMTIIAFALIIHIVAAIGDVIVGGTPSQRDKRLIDTD